MSPQEALAVLADDERSEAERIGAAETLGRVGTIAEIQPMLGILERSEVALGLAIAAALRALDAGALLARELQLGSDAKRERAAMGLLRIADPGQKAALIAAAQSDRSEAVRDQAYQALARLEGADVDEALVPGLADPSADVRCIVAEALGRRSVSTAAPALRDALAKEEDPLARDYLTRALRRLGG